MLSKCQIDIDPFFADTGILEVHIEKEMDCPVDEYYCQVDF